MSSIVFDDGRVVFTGRKDTSKVGVWNKKVAPEVYAELLTTIVRTKVLDEEIKRGTCLKGRSMLIVMRSASDAGDVRTRDAEFRLRGACRSGQADRRAVHRLHRRRKWLAPPK